MATIERRPGSRPLGCCAGPPLRRRGDLAGLVEQDLVFADGIAAGLLAAATG